MKNTIMVILSVCFILPCLAMGREKSTFDVQSALGIIRDLTADSLQGRRSGQTGGTLAEAYIASWFKKWQLAPAGENGSYYQQFVIPHWYLEPGVRLIVKGDKGDRNFIWGEDFKVARYSGSAQGTAEIVFSGYGIHAPEKGYDDYSGINVKNRWAMFALDVPKSLSAIFVSQSKIMTRVLAARKLGARGVILFQYQAQGARRIRARLKKEIFKDNFVILTVESRISQYIFKDMPVDLRYVFRSIQRDKKPQSRITGKMLIISVKAGFDARRPTRNILAKIPGSGPLRNECVMVGAHMDHLGINPVGEVMNGANDNASGTAVTMELARVLNKSRRRSRRTIVFALWAAEEQGLLGSNHYASRPTHPLQKTVAYLNLDMVGHGNGRITFDGKYYAPHVWNFIKVNLPEELTRFITAGRGGPGGSDHTPFLYKGVPAFSIEADGFHVKYHHSRDDVDLIKPMVIKRIGDSLFYTLKLLANSKTKLIRTRRQELFQYKYQYLTDFQVAPLTSMASTRRGEGDVDIQLVCLTEAKDLSGDALRHDMQKKFIQACTQMADNQELRYYNTYNKLRTAIDKGRTSLLMGVYGSRSYADHPAWLEIFARMGVRYLWIHTPSLLFEGSRLSDRGRQVLRLAGKNKILVMTEGLDSLQAKVMLEHVKQRVALLVNRIPGEDVLSLVKAKRSALGLILRGGETAVGYFSKLDQARKMIGSDHIFLVNQQDYRRHPGKGKIVQVIVEMLKAQYTRSDISNLFSTTFLKLLENDQ